MVFNQRLALFFDEKYSTEWLLTTTTTHNEFTCFVHLPFAANDA